MEYMIQGIIQGVINIAIMFSFYLIMRRIEKSIIELIKNIDDSTFKDQK